VHSLTGVKHEDLAELCRHFHVRRLAAFGSAIRDDFNPDRSDIDLLVEFEPLSPSLYADNYFKFLDSLTQLFTRNVDLIVWKSIKNPYFLREVESSQELLYAA
jgi:uncharacterized protein